MAYSDWNLNCPQYVSNLPIPPEYLPTWFMNMEIEASPIGNDPETGQDIYWGDGHMISCDIEDPKLEIPF